MKKNIVPGISSFFRKNQTKVVRKTEDDGLPVTIFTEEATPEKRPERVRCISRRRSIWPQLSRTWSRSWRSRIEFSVRSIQATMAVDRARPGAADRVGSLQTLPSQVIDPTSPDWAHMTWECPQNPQKWGWWILPGSRRLGHLVLILGRRADHHMIFQIFPYLFYHGFFVGSCSKFCVKKKRNPLYSCYPWTCRVLGPGIVNKYPIG